MHSCPRCGQACYCHGDIDDCVVETEAYSSARCTCDCDEEPDDDFDDGWDDHAFCSHDSPNVDLNLFRESYSTS